MSKTTTRTYPEECCDACYYAEHEKCVCSCKGKHHAKGTRGQLVEGFLVSDEKPTVMISEGLSNVIKSSVVSYVGRGYYGRAGYRGNTTGRVVKDLILQKIAEGHLIHSLLDPMEGGGTCRYVAYELGLRYDGFDLRSGFDLVEDPLPDRRWDFTFMHPPYWNMIRYSDDPRDLSTIGSLDEYLHRLRICVAKCMEQTERVLVVQMGDLRRNGRYTFLAGEVSHALKGLSMELKNVLIKRQWRPSSLRNFYGGKLFVPILHEYLLVYEVPR